MRQYQMCISVVFDTATDPFIAGLLQEGPPLEGVAGLTCAGVSTVIAHTECVRTSTIPDVVGDGVIHRSIDRTTMCHKIGRFGDPFLTRS
jgi:hypothetical protein